MGRYGRYKRKKRIKLGNIGFKLVAIFIVVFIAISISVTFYWYFKNNEENKKLRSTYLELQNQINEKKSLIDKLKKMREEELKEYEMKKRKIMSIPKNKRVDQKDATDTGF